MKHLFRFFFITFLCCSFQPADSQVPISICGITTFPINEMEVVTVGTVTEIVSDDEFMLTSEGCSILCDGEINELPLPGFEIYILGVVEYEQIGNDLDIDTDYWVLIDNGQPDPDPPPAYFTVEDAISAPFGSIALLTGEVTEYMDEVTGFGSFTDPTGSMDMDFKSNDMPEVDQLIHVLGTNEPGNQAPPLIDVFSWHYDGEEPPPDPDPIGWNIGEIDSLPIGTVCFIYGAVTSWSNEPEGEGDFNDGTNNIAINFADTIDLLPELNDSIYIMGKSILEGSERKILVYHWMDEFSVGIDEIEKMDAEISIFPNPVKDVLYIKSESKISSAIIYNMEGKVIMDVRQINQSTINTSSLQPGVYVMSLFNGHNYLVSKRLVIE
jgi:hypothetical protein